MPCRFKGPVAALCARGLDVDQPRATSGRATIGLPAPSRTKECHVHRPPLRRRPRPHQGRTRSAARRLVAEIGAQLKGSDDTRVVGLRNRLEENDDWAVADALAELDIAEVARTW